MDFPSELVFENGLPRERIFTSAEILNKEDRLITSAVSEEPPSDPLTSEPSSGSLFEPSSEGNLPKLKTVSVDLNYKRRAVAYWKDGSNE